MEKIAIDLSALWTAAGILLGFQISSVRWRIDRETKLEMETTEPIWLPPHDYLNLISMLITSVGIFLLPALGLISHEIMLKLFALSTIFLCGYAFSAFGHYKLYKHRGPRKWFPLQEIVPVGLTLLAAGCLVWQ